MKINLKIGLIGLGIWGRKIARDLIKIGVELHVCDISSDRRSQALELGAVTFTQKVLALRNMNGLIIASTTSTHYRILKQVLPWNIPVFVEKPIVASLAEAEALGKLVHKDVFVMHVWKYHRGIQALAQIAQSQELGSVLGVRSTRANWTSPRRDVDSVWNLMPHDLSILIAILDYLPEVRAAVVEQHPDLVRGMYAILGNTPWAVIEVSNRYEYKCREVRLHCQNGVAILRDEKTNHLEIYHGGEHANPEKLKKEIRMFNAVPPLYEELRVFCRYISGDGEPPLSDFDEGIAVIRRIHELKASANL
ncbi:Gfo/Idh/MocA family protein [Phaeodactylibacter xiamenensis]|jgi:predicted dehydrogenase|uniref:Gfo/Idh/MocA family protein n=1 Tax=Phaeodactylibacter xiamenensis TaxID=1524460 RepID=UPI0024A8C7B2|nr:Gfo/Idh/MocA family oxidoreductase [Phaeodactylibacter xiamenensis]